MLSLRGLSAHVDPGEHHTLQPQLAVLNLGDVLKLSGEPVHAPQRAALEEVVLFAVGLCMLHLQRGELTGALIEHAALTTGLISREDALDGRIDRGLAGLLLRLGALCLVRGGCGLVFLRHSLLKDRGFPRPCPLWSTHDTARRGHRPMAERSEGGERGLCAEQIAQMWIEVQARPHAGRSRAWPGGRALR